MNKQEMLDRVYQLGFEYEAKYTNCAQCVLAAIQDVLGGIDDEVFKAAHALSGGLGSTTQGTCGALSGGAMAIGSRYGRDRAAFATSRPRRASVLTKQLYDRFVAEHGSPLCRCVHQHIFGRTFDFWDADDMRAFEAGGGHVDKCPTVVAQTARWAAEILLNAAEEDERSDAGRTARADR
jgi:C_GCAxxG_C_C family probable redox protein